VGNKILARKTVQYKDMRDNNGIFTGTILAGKNRTILSSKTQQ
jgi:hypothetical protein